MTSFLVVGDAILDVTVAPSRPLRPAGDVPAVIRLGPGGQGANVAVRLARHGAEVALAAPIATDAGGRFLAEALARDGVRLVPITAARTAVVVALLDAGGERSMLSDRQSTDAARVVASLEVAGWIHVSAYALLDDDAGDALARSLGERRDGVRLSVAGGSIPPEPALVSRFLNRIRAARPELLVVSREEAAALLGGPALARDAAGELGVLADVVIVTAGELGSVARAGEVMCEIPAPTLRGPALDATGAGDAFAAAVIMRLAGARWPPSEAELRAAIEAASLDGARVARVVGAQSPIDGEQAVRPV